MALGTASVNSDGTPVYLEAVKVLELAEVSEEAVDF